MGTAGSGKPLAARIDERACIGCALCLEACPVDAIVGAARRMHTVIASECTGCGWCLPPCPVDCISLVETGERLGHEERRRREAQYRRRHRARRARLERDRAERAESDRKKDAERKKRAVVELAMQRARRRLRERNRGR